MRIFFIAVLIFGFSKLFACSCKLPGTIEEVFNTSEVIIHGKVINKCFASLESAMSPSELKILKTSLKENQGRLEHLKSQSLIEIQILILKIFKGKIAEDLVTIYTTRSGASCGFLGFEEDRDFIIYASTKSHAFWIFDAENDLEKEHTFWTNQCTRTSAYHTIEANALQKLMKS